MPKPRRRGARARTDPLHLDLAAVYCTRLNFSVDVEDDSMPLAKLEQALGEVEQDTRLPWFFGENYDAGGRSYTLEATISRRAPAEPFFINVDYQPEGSLQLYGAAANTHTFVSTIGLLGPKELICVAEFEYPTETGESTILVPFNLPHSEGERRLSIHGVELSILDKDDEFEAFVEVSYRYGEKRVYTHKVSLFWEAALTPELPRELLERACSISRSLFTIQEPERTRRKTKQ